MATKSTFQEDDEELGQKNISLESGVVGTQAQSGAPGSTAKGTGWTNLQQYLETNKGAGGAIADAQLKSVNDEIGSSKSAINQWADTAQKRAQESMRKDEWSGKIAGKSADEINNTFKDPSQAQAFDSWKKLQNYWGASDATADTDYKGVFDTSRKVEDKIANANTWEGQNQLSKDAFSKTAADRGSRYSSGMGVLDTFVARGDAGNKYDSFQAANTKFGDNLKTASSKVDAAIGAAKDQGKANYKTVMDTISGRINTITAEQQARAEAENAKARAEADKWKAASFGQNKEFKRTVQADPYLSTVGGMDVATDAEIAALNTLGGMDDDVSTGGYFKGSNTAGFDLAGYQKAVEDEFATWRPSTPAAPTTPVAGGSDILSQILGKALGAESTTTQVSPTNSGTGQAGEETRTNYPDGSYTVKGPQGEVIHYNADGTIRKTSGNNIFT